jgi:Asp-tRNA(Asn)/Glu-tRNA(Gln) amidotransferase C subunit
MNTNISHQYIRSVVQIEYDELDYEINLIHLPADFKKKGKTSKKRGVTDIASLQMLKNKNIKFSGEMVVDELFTNVDGKRQYTVSIFANEIKDMPIAIAIMNTRHFDVMKTFFDFVFQESEFKALTSDMLAVYNKIATSAEVPHQNCIIHWMKNNGKKIKSELEKDELSKKDKINITKKFTEIKEILRCFDKEKKKKKISEFKKDLSHIPDFFENIVENFFEKVETLTAYSKNNKIPRTSSKAETFHSLPQIRQIKHTSKKPWSLLLSLGTIVLNYKPNYRTLRFRQ